MDDAAIKLKLDGVQADIDRRRIQLRELRFNYDLAKQRLKHVELTIRKLEEQYELLAQGQLPLFDDDPKPDL